MQELASADAPVERVLIGPPAAEETASPGDESIVDTTNWDAVTGEPPPLVFEVEIDVARLPVLHSHVIDGRAVVPLALLPEWFAHGALHGHPGLRFVGFDDLRLFKGIVLDEASRARLRVHAEPTQKSAEGYRVPMELRGLHDGDRAHLHARATVLLSDAPPVERARVEVPDGPAWPKSVAETYDAYLFHGPDLHGITSIDVASEAGVVVHAAAGPKPARWMDAPVRRRWLADPLAIDVGLQLLVFWTGAFGAGASLPCRIGRYRQFRAFPKDGTRVVLRVTEHDTTRALGSIEIVDGDGRLVARLEDCENTIEGGLARRFRSNRLSVDARS